MDESTIGDRVRRARILRGMTQVQLARASRVSVRTLKDVEQGVGNHRNATLHAIAEGLKLRTSDLALPGQAEHQPVPAEPWEDVRDALYRRVPGGEPDEVPTPASVLAGIGAMMPAWRAAEYSRARVILPGLIRDAMDLGRDEEERAAKSRALNATAWLLTMTRQFEDGLTAGRLALEAAPGILDAIAAVSTMSWCLLRQGQLGEARDLAVKWADENEPKFSRATTTDLAGYGKLLLYVHSALLLDNQGHGADDALAMARAAAARIGRDVPVNTSTTMTFGPAQVEVITAEAAAIQGRPDEVLAIAGRITGLERVEPAQRLRHRLDVARARSMRRDWDGFVEDLQGLQAAAPEWLRSQQYARDILEDVIRRRRGPWDADLRNLAEAVQLVV